MLALGLATTALADLRHPMMVESEAFMQGQTLKALLKLEAQEEAYLNSPLRQAYLDTRGIYHSILGEYAQAHQQFAQIHASGVGHQGGEVKPFQGWTPINAQEAIIERLKGEQVLMINEAHHVPQHRAFTLQLLESLYAEGFRYFAAETLSEDPKLKERGYPQLGVTGFYTQEPVYGNLIREALRLGFKIVPYEDSSECVSAKENPYFCQNLREENQAKNLIARTLKQDPFARVVVHVGYGHHTETAQGEWKPMGYYFKQMTGIDPLTIDQQRLSPRAGLASESADYIQAIKQFQPTQPMVLVNAKNQLWQTEALKGVNDIEVFHPRSLYIQGRPHWLLWGGRKQHWPLNEKLCQNQFPCLVQLRPFGEPQDSVPVDQVVLRHAEQKSALVTETGSFVVSSFNGQGKQIATHEICAGPTLACQPKQTRAW